MKENVVPSNAQEAVDFLFENGVNTDCAEILVEWLSVDMCPYHMFPAVVLKKLKKSTSRNKCDSPRD